MPNPKNKFSNARRDKRRANWKLTVPTLVKCKDCDAYHMPHHVCPACGKYDGRQVLSLRRGQVAES